MSEPQDDTDDPAELYADALRILDAAKEERERTFPYLEALRYKWKEDFEELDRKVDKKYIQVVIDNLIREVEETLEMGPDDEPLADPADHLETYTEEWNKYPWRSQGQGSE